MSYTWLILVFLQLLVLSMQPRETNADCCPPRRPWNICVDGSVPTPCCGVGDCNFFCCNCICRSSYRPYGRNSPDNSWTGERQSRRKSKRRGSLRNTDNDERKPRIDAKTLRMLSSRSQNCHWGQEWWNCRWVE